MTKRQIVEYDTTRKENKRVKYIRYHENAWLEVQSDGQLLFGMLYAKCLCVLSRYVSQVVEWSLMSLVSIICQMFVCVVPLCQPSSREPRYPPEYPHRSPSINKYKEKNIFPCITIPRVHTQ